MLPNRAELTEPLNPSDSVALEVAESAQSTAAPSRRGLFSRAIECVPNPKYICAVFAGAASLAPIIVTAATDCFSALKLNKEDNHCDSPVGNVAAVLVGIEVVAFFCVAFVGVNNCRNRR